MKTAKDDNKCSLHCHPNDHLHEFIARFDAHLKTRGYSHDTRKTYLSVAKHFYGSLKTTPYKQEISIESVQ